MPSFDHMPKYDGLHIFLPNVDLIQEGDILLTRNVYGEESKGSIGIAKITKGDFSHALICSTPPTFVEALPNGGVRLFSIQRCFVHDLNNVLFLRYPDKLIAEKAGNFALEQVGRSYSKKNAAYSIFPDFIKGKADKGTFCSALVAYAYKRAGGGLFSALTEKTTPATIQYTLGLLNITKDIFRKSLSPRNIEIMSALDGNRTSSPSDRQADLHIKYRAELDDILDEADRFFSKYSIARPDGFIDIFGYIIKIFDKIREGVVISSDIALNLDSRVAAILDRGEILDVAKEMLSLESESSMYMINESFKAKPDIDLENVRGMLIVTAGQIEARKKARDSLDAWLNAGNDSLALRKWNDIQNHTITVFENRHASIAEVLGRIGKL